jgi:hypothetical protein
MGRTCVRTPYKLDEVMEMQSFESMGKMLILMGLFVLLLGLILTFAPKLKIPFLGRLPGDIRIEREGFSLYFPIVTCIVLSVLLTLLLNLIAHLLGR